VCVARALGIQQRTGHLDPTLAETTWAGARRVVGIARRGCSAPGLCRAGRREEHRDARRSHGPPCDEVEDQACVASLRACHCRGERCCTPAITRRRIGACRRSAAHQIFFIVWPMNQRGLSLFQCRPTVWSRASHRRTRLVGRRNCCRPGASHACLRSLMNRQKHLRADLPVVFAVAVVQCGAAELGMDAHPCEGIEACRPHLRDGLPSSAMKAERIRGDLR
jgi:hypothetical protein